MAHCAQIVIRRIESTDDFTNTMSKYVVGRDRRCGGVGICGRQNRCYDSEYLRGFFIIKHK